MLSEERRMEILEAYDLTKSYRAAAALIGCDHHTVKRYVSARAAGLDPTSAIGRPKLADAFVDKIAEWIDRSGGRVRADVVHGKLLAMGYPGSERTTRRVVAVLKRDHLRVSHRIYRPWIPEPGLWLQWDYGHGPAVDGMPAVLFCAWLAWSRYRVIIPLRDKTLPSVIGALDACFRHLEGVPTYCLTDNERTVTDAHIAGIAVRNPQIVSVAQYYGTTIATCVPADPESKGGSENTVKLAKADLVPTEANLRDAYSHWGELEAACTEAMGVFNHRMHREIAARPAERRLLEVAALHAVPAAAYTIAFGETRAVSWSCLVAFRGARYSVPHRYVDTRVWVRVQREEVVIVAPDDAALVEVARHPLLGPGQRSVLDEHYPIRRRDPLHRPPRATNLAEAEFLSLGEGARRWLTEAAAVGVRGIQVRMAEAVRVSKLWGTEAVEEALGLAAFAGRFAQNDLISILTARHDPPFRVSDTHSLQPGTAVWARVGLHPDDQAPVDIVSEGDTEPDSEEDGAR